MCIGMGMCAVEGDHFINVSIKPSHLKNDSL